MTEMQEQKSGGTPWYFWVIAIIAFLWNAMGALDYIMTQIRSEAYMGQFTPEQLEFFYSFPAWVVAAWAIAVWGGMLGSVLHLMKKRLAVWIFLISLFAMVITSIRNYFFANGYEACGTPGTAIFSAAIFLVSVGLYLYARAMQKRGLLT
jgi:hypothetical protein